jgi:hypothetical protein
MRSATAKIQAGDYTGGYAEAVGGLPLMSQNPLIAQASKSYLDSIGQVAEFQQNQMWNQLQRSRMGGGGGGGGNVLPAMTQEERARQILLGETPVTTSPQATRDTGAVNFDQPTDMDAVEVVDVDVADMPKDGGEESAVSLVAGPETAPDMNKAIEGIASAAKTEAFKKALTDSVRNPPPKEARDQAMKFMQQYDALPEEQKTEVINSVSTVVKSPQETSGIKNFKPLDERYRKIVGDNIIGFVLEPVVEAEGVTAGRTGESVKYGTNKAALDKFYENFTAASQELSMGELGKFIKQNGGVFNVTATPTGEQTVFDQAQQKEIKTPAKIEVYSKNADPTTGFKMTMTPPQYAALQTIQKSPSEFQRLQSNNSMSTFVRLPTTGPTPEAARGLPAAQKQPQQQQQRRPINSFFGEK